MKVTGKRKPRPRPMDLAHRANQLGVSRGHLSMVLRGKRESLSLLARYAALTARKPQPKTQAQPH